MSIHVSVDLNGLNNMLSARSLNRARTVLANQAMADMDQFVPYKQGHLAGSAHLDAEGNIVYATPYARAQFYGMIGGKYPVVHYTRTEHPQATKRWDLKAVELYGDDWFNKVKKSLLEGK